MPSQCLRSGRAALLADLKVPGMPSSGTGVSGIQDRRTDGPRRQRLLEVILGLLVLARLGFAALVYARPDLALANDSDRYVPIANSILAGRAYAWSTQHPGELLNTIGYPLFLAGVFAGFGREPGDVALAQLLATGALAVLMYAALGRRLGPTAGFAAAAVVVIDPLTILWSMTVLTEAVFAVALGMGAVLLASWSHSRNTPTLVLAGLLCAVACLVKPFALLIVALWTAGILVFPHGKGGAIRAQPSAGVRPALMFLLPAVVLIAPWFVRNGLLWECPTLSSVDRVTMRDYVAAKVLAEAEHVELAAVQSRLQDADPGVCPRLATQYWRIILDNPGTYLRLHAAGTLPVLVATNFDRWLQYVGTEYTLPDLWRPYMDGGWNRLIAVMGDELRLHPGAVGLLLALTAFQVLLYAVAVMGAVAALRNYPAADKWCAVILTLTILILVLTPGQGGHERFRVPVQPLLAILTAYAVARMRARTPRVSTAPPPSEAA